MVTENRQQPMQSYAPPPTQQYYQPPPACSYTPSYQPSYQVYRPPSPLPAPQPLPAPSVPIVQQRSSPIGERSEEDDILDAFWQWKKESTSRQARKLQYCQVQSIVEKEMWSIDNLKSIADISSTVYKRAIDAGLPNGLIRCLKGDLREFKNLWREKYQHARNISTLVGQLEGRF